MMSRTEPLVHVLIVDDHADTAMLQAMILRKQGHEVLTASSAATALAIARQQPVDLLVSDIRLPDRSGVDLMRELRPHLGCGGIALTGAADEHLVESCREAGYSQVLVKPVTPERLLDAVAATLAAPEG